jgi:hypothetical protein
MNSSVIYLKWRIATILLCIISQAHSQSTIHSGSDTSLTIPKKTLNFIAMGDWGRNGEYNQREVARQMGITAKALKGSFIIALGDNFYPSGVASILDHRWVDSYEDIYTAHSLQDDWYVVLGNHDYKGNPDAELQYSKVDRRWNMPARYFSKKIFINGDTSSQVLLVFIDTTPLIAEYYHSADHAGNVKSQDTLAQRKWLEEVLSDPSPNIKWRIVAGHHPIYSGGKRIDAPETRELNQRLRPIFEKYKVDAYIAGHEHSLQYIKPEGHTHYFISGAGSETTPAVLYPDGGKYAISENGFMAFSITPESMLVQVQSYQGKVLYKETIRK